MKKQNDQFISNDWATMFLEKMQYSVLTEEEIKAIKAYIDSQFILCFQTIQTISAFRALTNNYINFLDTYKEFFNN